MVYFDPAVARLPDAVIPNTYHKKEENMRKGFILALLLMFAGSLSAFAADISGNWELKRTGPKGEEVWNLTFAQTGNDFTVTGTHSQLGEVTGSGKVEGNKLTMLDYLKTPVGRIHVQFDGQLDGDKISGTSQSVGIDNDGASGGASGAAPAAGGGAPSTGTAPSGAAPAAGGQAAGGPGGAAPGGAAPTGAPEGAAPAGGSDAGASGGVDHTKPIAFTGVRK